ncbi:MAG: hypothetical protein Q9174_005833 [Haloplaca sp. 1 TL-2023]
MPRDHLPAELPEAKIALKHGLMDQYYVSEDHLIDAILGLVYGRLQTSVGTTVLTTTYCRVLADAMRGGAEFHEGVVIDDDDYTEELAMLDTARGLTVVDDDEDPTEV